MSNENHSSAAAPCGRIVDAHGRPTNTHKVGALFCPLCEDAFAALVRPGRSPKITGLFCLTCQERVMVRRGYLLTRPPLLLRLGWNLARLVGGAE